MKRTEERGGKEEIGRRDNPLYISRRVAIDEDFIERESKFNSFFVGNYDAEKYEPGFLALDANEVKIAELLLKLNLFGSVQARNRNGDTPLHRAAEMGQEIITGLLLEKSCDELAIENNRGYSPLHLAAQKGYTAIVGLLLKRSADIDAPAGQVNECVNKGLTALALAAANGHSAVGELLIEHKATIEGYELPGSRYNRGLLSPSRNQPKPFLPTPLELAAMGGHAATVRLLATKGADLRLPSAKKETTLLHLVAKKVTSDQRIDDSGYLEVIAFLVRHGFKVDATDENGKSPIIYAIENNRKKVEEALLAHSPSK